jgi:HlyD family secretion protein
LSRVAVDQRAELELDGRSHTLKLARINPQVKNGQFEVELVFDGPVPAGLRRGQTVQPRLALGASTSALLLPIGAWLTDGGGTFAFVVNGDRAERRALTLGRRNVRHVEVLAGLKAGEQVVVSSYAGYADKEQLNLD